MLYRGLFAALSAAAVAGFFIACSDANGTINGGDPRDSGSNSTSEDGSTSSGEGGGGEAGPCGTTSEDGGVPTFTQIYDTILGPSGVVSCAGTGQCHGGASQAGTIASGGYMCTDKDTCYNTMVSSVTIVAGSTGDPTQSILYSTIRHVDPRSCNTVGTMPLSPPAVLTPEQMQGIAAWTKAGAANN